MQFHFDNLEALADYLENEGKKARAKIAATNNITNKAKLQSEAYGYEQSAFIVRNSKLTND